MPSSTLVPSTRFLPLPLLLLAACSTPTERHFTPAFYHWRTALALSPAERGYLDSLGCKKLYVKTLDIGRDPMTGRIVPYSRLEVRDTVRLAGLEIVPTVFITNEVFQGISEEEMEGMVRWFKVVNPTPDPSPEGEGRQDTHRVLEHVAPPLPLGEGSGVGLQLDCDWTPSTRAAYFSFLKKLRIALPPGTQLSVTVRLHQYKFPQETGVPPADRGMLMLYNTGDVDDTGPRNSIFDPADARKYIAGAPDDYPLPLDVALPLFSWTLVFRDDALWKIIPELPLSELHDRERFEQVALDPAQPHALPLWKVQRGTFVGGHYLRPGDVLRRESLSPDLLRQAAQLAAHLDLADDATVAFFHLDSAIIHRYPVQLIDSVWKTVQSSNSPK